MVLIVFLAGVLSLAFAAVGLALLVGTKVQITEEDRERAKVQPILMLVHRDYRWTLPALAEDFFARILPELISSSRRDARSILSEPVRPAAYLYLALLYILLAVLELAWLLCRWISIKPLARWEGTLLDALSGLLVCMARCQRA